MRIATLGASTLQTRLAVGSLVWIATPASAEEV